MTTHLYRCGDIPSCTKVSDHALPIWRVMALSEGFHYLYKGYRTIDGIKTYLVIITNLPWDDATRDMWRQRGMKNIREYDLVTGRMHAGTDNP